MKFKTTAFLLALTYCCIAGQASAQEGKLSFNLDWHFIKQDVAGAQAQTFDDSSWKLVSAPHTYNDTDTFDDFSSQGHKGEMNQWGGKTWYRKTFFVSKDWKNKSVIIEFEAARQVAEVYCNGAKVVVSENGFLPFGAALDGHLRYGEENVIAVMCDNTFAKDTDFGGDRKKVWHDYGGGAKFPWNNPHWHPAHGGLYRNVFLHVSDKLHFTQPLYSNLKTVGSYVYAIDPSRASTGVGIEAEIANQTDKAQSFTLRSRVLDRDGKIVLELKKNVKLAAGETSIVKNEGTLASPKLWEPKHPYLYTVENEIRRKWKVIDRNRVPFGVRWTDFRREHGFYINDRYVKLEGWGIKSVDGWPGLGAANPDWMHHYTLQKVVEAGGNFVRWGHTAGGPVHLKAADELGIITQQPGVDGEGDVDGHAWDVRLTAWRDTVIYFRNNPSLLIWEGGNQSVTTEHVEALCGVVEQYDPHGGRVYGHRRANATVEPYCDLTISTEGSGYLKALPTVEGEYNREESPRRVWDRHTPPYEDWHAVGSYDLSSEEYAVNQIYQYEKIAPRAHGGGANWIFVDSTSGGRVETDVTRTSGEMDAMRLPKEAYYVSRVLFSDEPDLHIIGHWNYPEGTIKDIHIASDCDEVALFLNGQQLGRKKAVSKAVIPSVKQDRKTRKVFQPSDNDRSHPVHFRFPNVAWGAGQLEAVGYVDGKEVTRHKIVTAGAPQILRLTALTGPGGLQADGSDAAVFEIEALDGDGNRHPLFEGRVDFKLEGPGVWRGGYNSGKEKSTNKTFLDLECGVNRVIVRSTRKSGTITLTAVSGELQPATRSIEAAAVEADGGISKQLPQLPAQGELIELPVPAGKPPKDSGDAADAAADGSRIFEDVSYSGPAGRALVGTVGKGKRVFTDSSLIFKEVPARLAGGEQIILPSADWNYSAVDLLQFSLKKSVTVYVAHDVRLPKLNWLKEGFADTGETLKIGEHEWNLYQQEAKGGDSVLIGSNAELPPGETFNMMMVFGVPQK
jgi:beta-galactosidase